MSWDHISYVFVLAIVKFMFAPFTGSALGLPFWETYLASVAGGSFSAVIFFFFSDFIIKYSHKRKVKKRLALEKSGQEVKRKKIFTRTNRAIIRTKRRLGIIGICFYAPFFLSVPVGSIVAAKFYGKLKKTFPLIILGLVVNAMITTSLAYVYHLFK